MLFNRQLQGFLLFMMIACIGLLYIDYYLLIFYEGTIEGFAFKALKLLEGAIPILRIGIVAGYVILLYLSLSMIRYDKPSRKRGVTPFPLWVQVLGFLLALIGGWWFINFERFPLNFQYFYPVSFLMFFVGLPLAKFILPKKPTSFVKRPKLNTEDSISFPTRGRGYINNVEPYRHTLVVAGSGSGKSGSIVRRTMISHVKKGFCGLIFDYKYPALTNELHTILVEEGKRAKFPLYVLDFNNVRKSHRVNILEPAYIKNMNYAEEFATVFINNLDKSTIKNPDGFFTISAIRWLTAIIYFYKLNHPQQCTLSHVINTILYHDYKHVFSMLRSEPVCDEQIRTIITSIDTNAERQLAGQISTLQGIITKLNTEELAWRLSSSDFTLDINNPDNPVHLSIGMDPKIRKSLAPVISCLFTVALQQMNVANKHKSYLTLDEAAALYLNDMDHLAAVARDNKIAITVILQELAMYREQYGADKAESIIGNLNNVFYGRVNSTRTAEMISKSIGYEPREVVSKGESMNYMKQSTGNMSQNYSIVDKPIIRSNEVQALRKGEFVGRTTDEKQPYFYVRFKEKKFKKIYPIPNFIGFFGKDSELPLEGNEIEEMIQKNFDNIRQEVETIISGYKNIYEDAGETQSSSVA